MTYFCFIESSVRSVPHMEPLDSDDLANARREAEALLDRHDSGIAAHIFKDEQQVATVQRAGEHGRPSTPRWKKHAHHHGAGSTGQPRGSVAPS